MDSIHPSQYLSGERKQRYRKARERLRAAQGPSTRESSGGLTADCFLVLGDNVKPLSVGVTRIGRARVNDVVLMDIHVSRLHCAIVLHEDQTAEIHDTASRNRTFLNGEIVEESKSLRDGDEIYVGSTTMIFLRSNPSAQSTSLDGQTQRDVL